MRRKLFVSLFATVFTASFLVAGVASAQQTVIRKGEGDNVGAVAQLAGGRGLSTAADQKAALEFWSPERMRASVPADLPADVAKTPTRKAEPTGPAGEVKPMAPAVASPEFGTNAQNASRAAGKVFFRKPNDPRLWHCSAAAIGSASRRLVLTAGHCLHTGKGGDWATEFVFAPYYYDGPSQHGTFAATYLSSKNGWINNSDNAYDIGIAVAGDNAAGHRVVDEVGGNGTRWNYSHDVYITMMGYPLDRDGGERPWACWGTTEKVSLFDGRIEIKCGFHGGASGGPWLQDYADQADGYGLGYANGVTSTVTSDDWNRSPYFDDSFKSLYDFAESNA